MIAGILGVVGIVFLLPGVIIVAVLISKEKDEIEKKKKIKKGIIFSILPFALVLISLVGLVIVRVIDTLLNK